DLYGPFWISTTLIIALFVTSSLAQSVASLLNGGQGDNGDKKKDVEMDVMVLSSAAFTIYPYVFGTPMGIWVVSSYLGENRFTLLELWCIYGYSVSVWLPVAVACMIPWGLLRWLFVAVGAVQSSAFILAGVKAIASRAQLPEQQQLKSAITMGIIGIQVVFALALKLYFFSYQTSWPSSGDGK
ncbi:Yip1-domain-containing protein, partial [Ramicandelaber brevisporus]